MIGSIFKKVKIVEGTLVGKQDFDDGFIVSLKTNFNETNSHFFVPKHAAWVYAHGGSGSSLELDESFNANVGKVARIALDKNGQVLVFRADSNCGFEERDIKKAACDPHNIHRQDYNAQVIRSL